MSQIQTKKIGVVVGVKLQELEEIHQLNNIHMVWYDKISLKKTKML